MLLQCFKLNFLISAQLRISTFKSFINHQLNPTSIERLDVIERFIVNSRISSFNSFMDSKDDKEPSRRNSLIAWFNVTLLFTLCIIICILIYDCDHLTLHLVFGVAIFPILF